MLQWILVYWLFLMPLALLAAQPDTNLADVRAYLRISDRLGTAGQITDSEVLAVKQAGYEVVVNLGPAREERNLLEGYLVTQQGMTYVHIPVSWEEPSQRDLQLFMDVMQLPFLYPSP